MESANAFHLNARRIIDATGCDPEEATRVEVLIGRQTLDALTGLEFSQLVSECLKVARLELESNCTCGGDVPGDCRSRGCDDSCLACNVEEAIGNRWCLLIADCGEEARSGSIFCSAECAAEFNGQTIANLRDEIYDAGDCHQPILDLIDAGDIDGAVRAWSAAKRAER